VEKILDADVVVIGPGDLYGSILSNLIIPEVCEALRNTRAKIVYNVNLTNKKGQTSGFSVDDYVEVIEKTIGVGRVDFVSFNTEKPAQRLMEKYNRQEGKGFWVEFFEEQNPKRKYKLIRGDFLKKTAPKKVKGDMITLSRSFIRHDSEKIAREIATYFLLTK
jgi:uncharacterized cofD-like protein